VPSANRITLLRDSDGDGVAETRTVFLKDLNSPFGMALIGGDFYVANTDAILRFPYEEGETEITADGEKIADLPAGNLNHHWTKSLIASPDGKRLYATVGSNSNAAENGWTANTSAPASSKSTSRPASCGCSHPGCAIPTAWPGNRTHCGPWSTSATSWAATWCRTT
jgi:glucose/arabinose dehydrogenase